MAEGNLAMAGSEQDLRMARRRVGRMSRDSNGVLHVVEWVDMC
jgi:hypothetical protein